MPILRLSLLAAVALFIVACGSSEERAAGHIAKAREFLEADDLVKAKLEAQNAAQIQPKNAEARFLLAEIAQEEQDFRAAVGHLLVAVDADPNLVEARTRLGLYYFLARAEEQTAEQATAVMEIAPENTEARLLNARSKYLQGDQDGAIAEARYALELDSGNADAVMFLSGMTAESEDIEGAFAILDAGLKTVPEDKVKSLRQFRLQLLARSGRFSEVEIELEGLANDFPEDESFKYALAQFYTQRDQPDRAVEVLRDIVTLDPENPAPKINLARLLVSQERADEAEQMLKQYIEEQPEQFELRTALGSLYESQGRLDDAAQQYETVGELNPMGDQGLQARNRLAMMEINDNELDVARERIDGILVDAPDNPDALLVRAAFAFNDADYDAAITDLRVALRRDEDSERALLLLARSYVRKGDGVLAQDTYRRLLAINPKHPEAPRELAALLGNQGDTAEAQKVLEARLEVEPGDTQAASGLISAMLIQEDLEGAEAEARRLVELNENNALAQLQLGRVMQAKGSPEEAIAAYKATLDENPNAIPALQGLVQVWVENERYDEAIAYLQNYRSNNPERGAEAGLLLGAVYVQKDDPQAADREFREVIRIAPQNLRAYVALGALSPPDSAEREAIYKQGLEAIPGSAELGLLLTSQYERQGRIEESRALYEELLEANPNNLIATNNLAALLLDYRDDAASFERALELAKKLEETDQPIFLDTLGWAYYRNGDYARAVRFLERAVAGAGKVPVLRYHLGMAYAANNNPVGAKQELTQALGDAETDFPGIDEARSTLEALNSS
jgi:tetratricopeptide (TPR) repeat protein